MSRVFCKRNYSPLTGAHSRLRLWVWIMVKEIKGERDDRNKFRFIDQVIKDV